MGSDSNQDRCYWNCGARSRQSWFGPGAQLVGEGAGNRNWHSFQYEYVYSKSCSFAFFSGMHVDVTGGCCEC